MGHQPSMRRRAVALAAALSAVLTCAIGFGLTLAHADGGDGLPGLEFQGFMSLGDLTTTAGAHPVAVGLSNILGTDSRGEIVYYDASSRNVLLIDPQSLTQVGALATNFPQLGTPASLVQALDAGADRAYIANQVAAGCTGTPLTCTAGPTASSPAIASVPLHGGDAHTLTLPSSLAGLDVVSMTPVTTDTGRFLYALVYQNSAGSSTGDFPGAAGHALDLVAIDANKLDSGAADAFLWSYAIPSCPSLPSWSTNSVHDFLGVDPHGSFAYFACRGLAAKSSLGAAQPAGAVVVDFSGAYPRTQDATSSFTTSYYPQGAGAQFAISGGDQENGLLFFTSVGGVDKQYVFDAAHRAWVGSVVFPIGNNSNLWGNAADGQVGRNYVVYARDVVIAIQDDQIPTQQGAELSLGDLIPTNNRPPYVDQATHQLFLLGGGFTHRDGSAYPSDTAIAVYQDTQPVPDKPPAEDPDSQTHDIDVSTDTPVTYGSFASAYGARVGLVGGVHSTPLSNLNGAGPALVTGPMCDNTPDPRLCFSVPQPSDGSRNFTFGQVEGLEVSSSSVNATSTSFAMDDGTSADSAALSNYNPADDLWNRFGASGDPPSSATNPVTDGVRSQLQVAPAKCSDLSDAKSTSSQGADAACDSQGRVAQADAATPTALGGDSAPADGSQPSGSTSPLQIGYAGSAAATRYLSDANTSVTQAVAVARDIRISIPSGPSITIGEVRTTATSTAAGRPGTAASNFTRSISDVTVFDPSGKPVFTCGFANASDNGQCDPRQLTAAVSTYTPSPVVFLTPTPDQTPSVAGSPGGAEGEVIKDSYQFINDSFTNEDSTHEVAGLVVMYVGDQKQPSRIVVSLAGVHVESHDAIGLPPPPIPPQADPTLKLLLTDGSTPAVPLAGGEFSLVGGDGTTAATCSTAADGIGSCAFPDVKPGSYTIKETKAPPGYAIAPDYQLSLDPGQDYTATFVNLLAIGAVHVSLTSAVDKKPLSGAVFAMYAGSSTLGNPLDTCKTGKDGTCGFTKVPLASYTMHQLSAPHGFVVSKDVPFSLSDPGQDATLDFVDGTPGVQAVAGKFIPGKAAVAPHTEVIGGGGKGLPAVPAAAYSTNGAVPPIVSSQPTAQAPAVAGLPQRIAALPAQLAKLLTHSPQQAVLLLFVWLVLGMPIYLWARRRQLLTATEGI